MGAWTLAEILLWAVTLQQSVAALVWWLCARLRVVPRVPALHWAAAALWAAGVALLTLGGRPPGPEWLATMLAQMVAPGVFVLLRLGLQTLLRVPRHDGEHLLVMGLAIGSALAGQLWGAPLAWHLSCAALLNAYSLLRTVQVCAPAAAQDLGRGAARLLLGLLLGLALLFVAAAAIGLGLESTQPLHRSSPRNVAVLALQLFFGQITHLALGLALVMRLVRRLRQLSRQDPLTGLPNRRALDEQLDRLLTDRGQRGHAFALLLLDIDHFKRVNDEYGHAVGDRALVHLSRVLRAQLREIDLAARFGGEEFVVLMPGTELGPARALAERLRAQVAAQPLRLAQGELALTISIGVAAVRAQDAPATLLARADAALYRAKRAGRNRVCLEEDHAGA